jgi:hypothetical protein
VVTLPLFALYLAEEIAKFRSPPGDEASFLFYAHNIVGGHYAAAGSPVASHYLWHGPGLPLILAPLAALHAPVGLMRLLGPLFLYLAVVVLVRAGDLVAPPRIALGLGYALGLYWPAWFTLGHIYVEPLAVLLVTAFLYHLVKALRYGSTKSVVWAGGASGFLALCRVEFGWVILAGGAVSALWWLRRRGASGPRKLLAISGVALVVCVPWLAYTYSLTGRFLYWGNSGGLSLYWMSSSQRGDLGDWHDYPDVFRDSNLAPHRHFFLRLERARPPEQDAQLERAGLRQIAAHPLGYLRNLAYNVSRLFSDAPRSFTNAPANRSDLLANLPLLAATFVAIFILRRRRRFIGPEVWPVAIAAALAVAIHVPVAAFARFLLPVIPLALWLCAAAVLQLRTRQRERNSVPVSAGR